MEKLSIAIFALPMMAMAALIAASALLRLNRGKVLVPRVPADAAFSEWSCSARSLRNILTRFGGASNCISVLICDGRLRITPQFPFTLMFLPEIYDLDVDVPISAVVGVEATRWWRRDVLRLTFRTNEHSPVELQLDVEQGFVRQLGLSAPAPGSRPLKAPGQSGGWRRWRKSGGLALLLLWGLMALTVSISGLADDYRYRRDGDKTDGVFVRPPSGISRKNGVIVYQVGGRTYQKDSWRGEGLFRVGESARILYLRDRPEFAREASELGFNLLWLCFGGGALSLAILVHRTRRRSKHPARRPALSPRAAPPIRDGASP